MMMTPETSADLNHRRDKAPLRRMYQDIHGGICAQGGSHETARGNATCSQTHKSDAVFVATVGCTQIIRESLSPLTIHTIYIWQEAQLSPRDRAMRLVSSNLANCHATVQNHCGSNRDGSFPHRRSAIPVRHRIANSTAS